jgi:CRP/FNR family transcriptional regulator
MTRTLRSTAAIAATGHPDFLAGSPEAMRAAFRERAVPFQLPARKQVSWLGQTCQGINFLQSGCVRVYLVGADGREITLYRVENGESCVLTAACILGGTAFPAAAVAECDCAGWTVPRAVFQDWVNREQFWREYVFRLLATRLGAVLGRFEEKAFTRLDARLAQCLLARADGETGGVQITHQALADELASAREAVSRVLMRWARAGWVRTGRGKIELRDAAALSRFARGV